MVPRGTVWRATGGRDGEFPWEKDKNFRCVKDNYWRKRKTKRSAATFSLLLILSLPLVVLDSHVEAVNSSYDYLLKVDRELMKQVANDVQSQMVDAIIVAARGLDSVSRLVTSCKGTVRTSLDAINALAVTVPAGSVESLAESSSVKKIWFDYNVALKSQADVSNVKAELLRRLISKATEKGENIEKTNREQAITKALDPELYEIPENGIVSLQKTNESDISLAQIGLLDVSPQTYFTYQVGAESLWALGYTGTGTYIAVLDVGATASHPMISGAVIGGHSEVPDEPEWDGSYHQALHGTLCSSMAVGRPVVTVIPDHDSFVKAVARWFPQKIMPPGTYPWGTIPHGYVGIAFVGEAPGAWLWVEKVLTFDGDGMLSWILAGMQHVLNLRKTTSIHIDVVSMSLGTPMPWSAVNDGTDPWSLMVNVLVANGITVTQSAGNSGPGAFTITQSAVACKNIGVGGYVHARMLKTYLDWYSYGYSANAHMADDAEMVWYFASRGPTRDYRTGIAVVAPCAFTVVVGGHGGLYWVAGTSFSAPRVAGEALLLIQYYKAKTSIYPTPETVKAAIVVGADFIAGYNRIDQGGGRWNPYKASLEILEKNVVGRANNILNADNYHDARVTNQITFASGISENTVVSLGIEQYSRFYFSLADPDMYRIAITDILETHASLNTLYLWVFDPKGDLANIGIAWRNWLGDIANYGMTVYCHWIVGETWFSGLYKWNQHWTPNDPGIWEIVVENDFSSWEPVGFTIRVEKSEVSISASAEKVVLKNRGVDIGLSAPGGLRAYEGYRSSASGNVRQGQIYTTTFNVLSDTKELLIVLDWDDDYFDKFPADLDLCLIDPLGQLWIGYNPPLSPMGIFGATVNIPETDYFGDYTAEKIIPGAWTALIVGHQVTPVSNPENFQLTIEGRIRYMSRSTKTYDVQKPPYFFEEPIVAKQIFIGDNTFVSYTLPFSFPFCDGKEYTTIYVGSNGYITFDAGYRDWIDSIIWNRFLSVPMIAVMAKDLETKAYVATHDNHVTILWYERSYDALPDRNLMLVRLYDNGDIVMSYDAWLGGLAGVSKGDGITYVTISPEDNTSFQFICSFATIEHEIVGYTISSIPYFWEEIIQTLVSGDDHYVAYMLPFDFPFCGTVYHTIYVGTNGYITFDTGYTYHGQAQICGMFMSSPTVAVMGTDLESTVYAIPHSGYVEIIWHGRAFMEPTGSERWLMLVQLYDNGDIIMSYNDWIDGLAGVSDGDGFNYIQKSPTDHTTFRITVASIIPPTVVFTTPNPWLQADSIVEVYYNEYARGNCIFASKHDCVEKFIRDGGRGYAEIFGHLFYENSEACH